MLQVLDTLDVVIDVGGTYEPEKDRYDHHQKGFEHVFGYGYKTKLSSAGLVYKVSLVPKQSGARELRRFNLKRGSALRTR
jgi:hypothetical protein